MHRFFPTRSRRLRRSALPLVQSLEIRRVPAVLVQIGVDLDNDGARDDIRIVGGGENTHVVIDDHGNGTNEVIISVDKNGDGVFGSGDIFEQVLKVTDGSCVFDLSLGGGHDDVFYQSNQLQGVERTFEIDLGSGNDHLFFRPTLVTDNTVGSRFQLEVDAGLGDDSVELHVPNSQTLGNSVFELDYDVSLGWGNDFVALEMGNLERGIETIAIDMGPGNNTFDLNLDGFVDEGVVTVSLEGGHGRDKGKVVVDHRLDDPQKAVVYTFEADLNGGDDVVDIDVKRWIVEANSRSAIVIDAGLGDDVIRVDQSTTLSSIIDGIAGFQFQGGWGDDALLVNIDTNFHVHGLFGVVLEGHYGHDSLTTQVAVANDSSGELFFLSSGGDGDDHLTFALTQFNATLVGGRAILHGGDDFDRLTTLVNPSLIDAQFIEEFS